MHQIDLFPSWSICVIKMWALVTLLLLLLAFWISAQDEQIGGEKWNFMGTTEHKKMERSGLNSSLFVLIFLFVFWCRTNSVSYEHRRNQFSFWICVPIVQFLNFFTVLHCLWKCCLSLCVVWVWSEKLMRFLVF